MMQKDKWAKGRKLQKDKWTNDANRQNGQMMQIDKSTNDANRRIAEWRKQTNGRMDTKLL